MEMRKVFSSHVDEVGYDNKKQELHVVYGGKNGKYCVYKGVPPDAAANVLTASSIGKALHEHIKGKYEHDYPED